MSSVEKKKFIIDTLITIKSNQNSTEYYKYILELVKSKNVNITKNKRGYYFNLNNLDDTTIDIIYNYLSDAKSIHS